MKTSFLVTTLALLAFAGFGTKSQAYERREEPRARNFRESADFRQLRAEIYQLNILFSRVDAQLRYGSGRYLRSDYSRLLRNRDRLNYELQRGSFDRLRVHAQIDRLRDELRELDVRLRVRRHSRWR